MTQALTRTHTTIATTGPSSKPTDLTARVDSSSPLLTSNSQIPGGATGGVYYDTRAVNSETVALAPKSRFKLLKTKLKAIAIDALLAARPQIWKDLSWHFNPPPTEYMTPAAHVDRAIRAPDVLPGRPEADERKRTIFVSACVDAAAPGGWRYNGGINEYNQLVRLLRSKGHDAYIVTFDGRYEPWLIEHQPTISIDEFVVKLRAHPDAICITSWAIASTFLRYAPNIHFWDMELSHTDNDHFATLLKLYQTDRIRRVAGISRTIQAWHMAHFGQECTIVPNLIDLDRWQPDPTMRIPGRIGYMNEGQHTKAFVSLVRELLANRHGHVEFFQISGDERACLAAMQTCDLFVNLNLGKDHLWGEGCPRTIIESMAAGCVNLSFDLIGNREIVIPGYNALIVGEKTPYALAEKIDELLSDRVRLEAIRDRARDVLIASHGLEKRWTAVRDFLRI